MLSELVREYGKIYTQIKQLKAQLDELQQQKEQLEKNIYEELQQQDLDKITVDNFTVYRRTDRYISLPKESEKAIAWLELNGFGELVRPYVPAQTLTSVLKEKLEEEPALLPEIKEMFNYTEKERVGIRVKK